MSISFQDANFLDYPAIAKLHADNWKRHYRGIYSDYFLDHEVEKDRLNTWRQRLTAPTTDQQIIIATQDEAIVGLACFYLNEHPQFGTYLDNLHVALPMQGSGIGRQLMQACAQRIVDRALGKNMYLWVFEANVSARRVYDRLGGQDFETEERKTEDGSKALIHRYVWQDVTILF